MKVLKIAGMSVIIMTVIFFILAAVAPKKYKFERTIEINAPRKIVFNNVKYWKNWQKWFPGMEIDPKMAVDVLGEDGSKNSKLTWEGDLEITGKGEMINKGVNNMEEMIYEINYILPWKKEADGYFRLTEKENKIEVIWGFSGKYPYPSNIMLLFLDIEVMKKDFDKGLKFLKNTSEREALKQEKNNNSGTEKA